MTGATIAVNPSLEERMRASVRKSYNNKIHNNPEFYEAEKKRVVAYIKNRYANDAEYRENFLRKKRENYAKRQAQKKKNMEPSMEASGSIKEVDCRSVDSHDNLADV